MTSGLRDRRLRRTIARDAGVIGWQRSIAASALVALSGVFAVASTQTQVPWPRWEPPAPDAESVPRPKDPMAALFVLPEGGAAAPLEAGLSAVATGRAATASTPYPVSGGTSAPGVIGRREVAREVATAKAYAGSRMAAFGWADPNEMIALDRLWTRESGWRVNATNPSSGAYGIPQSLPATKLAAAGEDWRTNAVTQIEWGLAYIRDRYGSPSRAWAHSQKTGWY